MSINNLFRRESQVMLAVVLLPILLGVIAAIAAPEVLNWVSADKCLDAGARYDSDKNQCVHEVRQ